MSPNHNRKKPTKASVLRLILDGYDADDFNSALTAGNNDFHRLGNQFGSGTTMQAKVTELLKKLNTDEIIAELERVDERSFKKAVTKNPLKYESEQDEMGTEVFVAAPSAQLPLVGEFAKQVPTATGSVPAPENSHGVDLGVRTAPLSANPVPPLPQRRSIFLAGAMMAAIVG